MKGRAARIIEMFEEEEILSAAASISSRRRKTRTPGPGRPKGTKNKPGHKAGRPRKKPRRITKGRGTTAPTPI